MDAEEMFDRVDALVDTDPLKLRDALLAVIGRIDQFPDTSAIARHIVGELRATLEQALS